MKFFTSWWHCVKKSMGNFSENEIAREVVDTAFHIHKALGPGLLETVYEVVLARELKNAV